MTALSKQRQRSLDAGQLDLFHVATGFVTKDEALAFVGAAPVAPALPDTREQAPDLAQWFGQVKAHAQAQEAASVMSREQQLDEGHALDGLLTGDFANVVDCEVAKRAAEIALAGCHTLQLTGTTMAVEGIVMAAEMSRRRLGLPFFKIEWIGGGADADLVVDQSPPSQFDRQSPAPCEASAEIEQRVQEARARVDEGLTEAWLDEPAQRLLHDAAKAMQLDAARVERVEAVALTIAALAGATSIKRIHIAEALSYAPRPPRQPEPEPEPEPQLEQSDDADDRHQRVLRAWRGDFEVVEVDPERLDYDSGDIRASYSADTLAMKGAIRTPFRFRGSEWVNTGMCAPQCECYRIVPVEAFDGPHAPYRDHDWDRMRGNKDVGSYHGMEAKQGGRAVVLQGPPVFFVPGQPEQAALL